MTIADGRRLIRLELETAPFTEATMNLPRTALFAALLTLTSFAGTKASAQCGGYAGGWAGYGYWDVGRLYSVLARNVPYYAAFPPVYYSVPVPRTYGYSPFAYPPGVMTPEVEVSEPLSINNPYYHGKVEPAKASSPARPADKTTSTARPKGPKVVLNPYIKPSLASTGLAATR
jgi:hypothetical protein